MWSFASSKITWKMSRVTNELVYKFVLENMSKSRIIERAITVKIHGLNNLITLLIY